MTHLGRSRNHSADTCRFLNLATNSVINSRDATWLGKVYGEWKQTSMPVGPDMATLLPVEQLEELNEAQMQDAGMTPTKPKEVPEKVNDQPEPEEKQVKAQPRKKAPIPPRRIST